MWIWQLTGPLRGSTPRPSDPELHDSDTMKKTCWWLGVDASVPETVAEKLPSVFHIMANGHFLSLREELFSQKEHYLVNCLDLVSHE